MPNTHSFRRRIKIGFGLVVVLAALIALVSLLALRTVIDTKDRVITEFSHDIVETRELELAAEQVASASRAFLLTGDPIYLERSQRAREVYFSRIEALRQDAELPEEQGLVLVALQAAAAHQAALDEVISAERKETDPRVISSMFEAKIRPRSAELLKALDALTQEKDQVVGDTVKESRRAARRATTLVAALGGTAALLACGLFLLSTRTLRRLERAELEVHDLNEHLEQRVLERTREIEGFAYSIAHDLRSPLRAMSGWSDVVLTDQGPRLDEDGRDALERIRKAAIRMDDLVGGLLGLARLSYESFPLSPVDIPEVLGLALAAADPEIRARGARIELHAPPLRVLGHLSLLQLSLTHLISNGLKFVAPGVAPRLRIWAEPWEDRVRIQIADNGIGIAPEYHFRVFGMFERLHPPDAYPGVGVGLTLAQRAVRRMGGEVGLSSTAGSGSTFWIELPTTASAVPAELQRL